MNQSSFLKKCIDFIELFKYNNDTVKKRGDKHEKQK